MLPGNELHLIEPFIPIVGKEGCYTADETPIGPAFKKIRQSWEEAILSSAPEHGLLRYFYAQLNSICAYADRLFALPSQSGSEILQAEIIALIGLLKLDYRLYFNWQTDAPFAYIEKWSRRLTGIVDPLFVNLQTGQISDSLKICLSNWLKEISVSTKNSHYTFRSLRYLEELITQLANINLHQIGAEEQVILLLSQFNFNHLSFFAHYQGVIRNGFSELNAADKIDYLQHQKAAVLTVPVKNETVYDALWPSLKCMMSGWLTEEINLAELAYKKEGECFITGQVTKLPLEISVAHLACLIRLLYEEGVIATRNLKTIFKCFAGHYQTKRQSAISPGSLSKEFYSIDQHTAARVQDLLQKMVARINRNFFPVVAAVSITFLGCQGIC